jgi:hypothetical protein
LTALIDAVGDRYSPRTNFAAPRTVSRATDIDADFIDRCAAWVVESSSPVGEVCNFRLDGKNRLIVRR